MLFRSDDVVFGDDLAKVKVEAKVVEHLRGPKIRVFKFKPKRGYKRTQGHRQDLTRIEVTDIKMLSRKPAQKKAAEDAERRGDAGGGGEARAEEARGQARREEAGRRTKPGSREAGDEAEEA